MATPHAVSRPTPRFGHWLPKLGLILALAPATPSWAARPDGASGLVIAEARVAEVLADANGFERAGEPGRGVISPKVAVARFEESLYLYMVQDYPAAAEGFFILVTTGALVEADLQLDAEWYLAESLAGMGNSASSEAWYQQIADDDRNPFHDDAVRRLLEVYAITGRTQEFQAYYDANIARGKVTPSDTITYSLAKAFYHQKDYARAKSSLSEIAADSIFYRKARYWLGAIAIVEGNLNEALLYFDEVAALSVDSPEDRRVYDLALLAGARIALEQKSFDDAAARYGRIGGDSEYLADKLYEETWTFISNKEDIRRRLRDEAEMAEATRSELTQREEDLRQAAQRGVEIFLLAFPEHPYTPQLKLLAGHLKQHARDWDGALETYEQVIAEYRPVRERFELLAADSEAASRYLGPLLEYDKTGYATTDLPAYALAMLVQDDGIKRAAELKTSLEKQRTDVATSATMIDEINAAFAKPEGLELHRRQISEVTGVAEQTLITQIDLLEEEAALFGAAVRKADLDPLSKRRYKLQERVYSGERGDAVEAELSTLRTDFAKMRPAGVSKADFAKIDAWHEDLAAHRAKLLAIAALLADSQDEELVRVRSRVTYEAGEVDSQRVELALTGDEADAVMTGLTRTGFEKLAHVFGDAAMTADMGIVDVYWATLLEATAQRTDLASERKGRMDSLEADFTRIRQQLGESK